MQRKWPEILSRLRFLALILEVTLLAVFYAQSYSAITRLDTGETPLYVDARGYLKLTEMFNDGSFLSTSKSLNSIDRVRRPPGFPVVISLSSFILGQEPAHALALVHYWAGLLVMLGLWYFVGKGIAPGATMLSLYFSGFFALQDPFRGAIPEWLLFLSLLAFSICLICFFRKATAGSSFLLISLITFISLLKSVFTPFIGAACLFVLLQKALSARAKIISLGAGVAPLLLWCGINFSVLGTPAPAVDLGYNLFGSAALLPWPELSSRTPEEETFRKLLSERRARAPGDLYEFLNTRAYEVSVQDYNIWAVAVPICNEMKFNYLECERKLRGVAIEILREGPQNYFDYISAQIRLSKNRGNLELILWCAFFSSNLLLFRMKIEEANSCALVTLVLGIFSLLIAFLHAAVAQLYVRYLLPCCSVLLVVSALMALSYVTRGIGGALRREYMGDDSVK